MGRSGGGCTCQGNELLANFSEPKKSSAKGGDEKGNKNGKTKKLKKSKNSDSSEGRQQSRSVNDYNNGNEEGSEEECVEMKTKCCRNLGTNDSISCRMTLSSSGGRSKHNKKSGVEKIWMILLGTHKSSKAKNRQKSRQFPEVSNKPQNGPTAKEIEEEPKTLNGILKNEKLTPPSISESDSSSLIVEFKHCPSTSRQSHSRSQNNHPAESKSKKNSIDNNSFELTALNNLETSDKVEKVKNHEDPENVSEIDSLRTNDDQIFKNTILESPTKSNGVSFLCFGRRKSTIKSNGRKDSNNGQNGKNKLSINENTAETKILQNGEESGKLLDDKSEVKIELKGLKNGKNEKLVDSEGSVKNQPSIGKNGKTDHGKMDEKPEFLGVKQLEIPYRKKPSEPHPSFVTDCNCCSCEPSSSSDPGKPHISICTEDIEAGKSHLSRLKLRNNEFDAQRCQIRKGESNSRRASKDSGVNCSESGREECNGQSSQRIIGASHERTRRNDRQDYNVRICCCSSKQCAQDRTKSYQGNEKNTSGSCGCSGRGAIN